MVQSRKRGRTRTRKERTKRKGRKTRRQRKQRGGAEDMGPSGYETVIAGPMPDKNEEKDGYGSTPVVASQERFNEIAKNSAET